jgi:hypothetical protein
VDVEFRALLILLQDGSQWSDSNPSHFIPGEKALVTHTTGGWVGPRTSLDASEMTKITFPCQIKRFLCHSACSLVITLSMQSWLLLGPV